MQRTGPRAHSVQSMYGVTPLPPRQGESSSGETEPHGRQCGMGKVKQSSATDDQQSPPAVSRETDGPAASAGGRLDALPWCGFDVKQAKSRGAAERTALDWGSRCGVLHSSAFHGERFHSPLESSRGTRSSAPPWIRAIRRASTEKGPHSRRWEAPAPCFTANAVVGLAVESSSSQECNRQHGMSTRSLQPKTRRGLMQPEAELYSMTVTNSSSTRNLKGRGPPAHLVVARMQADRLAIQSSRSTAPAKPMFHAKRGSGTLPVHL